MTDRPPRRRAPTKPAGSSSRHRGTTATTNRSGRARRPPTAARRPTTRRPTAARRRLDRRTRRWLRRGRAVVILAAIVFVSARLTGLLDHEQPPRGAAGVPSAVADSAPVADRDADVHAGYGTWVDVYDYVAGRSGPAPVTPDSATDMADQGVRTLYLQAARFDPGEPELLTDPGLLAEFLVQAHQAGMRVVGWYLPQFVDVDRDLAHLAAISDFEVLGHRFDGVAVDIEWTAGVPDHAERSERLVELSERLSETVDDDALGAVVLPPVQIEVVNQDKWPDFPWRDLADIYDVWLPMGYWTERQPESSYHDGWTYTAENIRRLRENLDDPNAMVHAIGGIGDRVTPDHARRFVRALDAHDAIGGSIYDWSTLDPAVMAEIADSVPTPDE